MIELTRDQSGLSSVLSCEICKDFVILGDRFYIVQIKEGYALTTKLYHFSCVQRGHVTSPEAKDRQEKLASVIAEREAAEQELEESEQYLSGLIAEKSLLRRKYGYCENK